MNYWIKKGLAAMIAAGLLLAMGACELSPDVIETCLNHTNQADSMTFEMDIVIGMTVLGQEVSTYTSGEGRSTSDPARVAMRYTQQVGGISVEAESYAEQSGDAYVQYTKIGDQWMKQSFAVASINQDPKQAMMTYLGGITRYQKEGEDPVAGKTASKYTAVISGDAIGKVLNASGAMSQLEQTGLDASQVADLYTDLGDLNVTLWVDETAMQAVKIEMNLTEMMKTLIEKIEQTQSADLSAAGLSITALSMSMTVTGYNNVDSIDIPDEALSASELLA